MNWKTIVGAVLILLGITQFLKIFSDYMYKNSLLVSIGLGFVFLATIITGIYLVKQGRMKK
jgi:hypothetical protein